MQGFDGRGVRDTIDARDDTIEAREATIAQLEADLSGTQQDLGDARGTVARLEGELADERDQHARTVQSAVDARASFEAEIAGLIDAALEKAR